MQFPPSPSWSFSVKHYLFLKCACSKALRLFSDGNTGLVFITRGQLKIQKKGCLTRDTLPEAFAYGQLGTYHDIFSDGHTEMLIIVFQPYGLFSLYGIPGDELNSQIIDACCLFGQQIKPVCDALKSAAGYRQQIAIIENYFANLARRGPKAPAQQLGPVVRTILQLKGRSTVNELTKLTGLQERQLERSFHQVIGLSPVKYLQIVRLHYFLSLMRSAYQRESLTIAGLASGYYDQAHLIHNFKQITGLTPTQYLSTASSLTVNLIVAN